MTGLFLQARMASSRFPGKALEKIGNRTILEHCMAALGYVRADYHVLLTDEHSRDTFRIQARQWGFDLFAGSEDDVLDRFARACEHYEVDTIVRATADNPLVSASLANAILAEHRSVRADYSGYLGMPIGTGVEVLSAEALMQADAHADSTYEREHVSPYIYHHRERYRTHRPTVEPSIQNNSRVTIDTPEDLRHVQRIFARLYRGTPIEIEELVRELRGHAQHHKQSA